MDTYTSFRLSVALACKAGLFVATATFLKYTDMTIFTAIDMKKHCKRLHTNIVVVLLQKLEYRGMQYFKAQNARKDRNNHACNRLRSVVAEGMPLVCLLGRCPYCNKDDDGRNNVGKRIRGVGDDCQAV